ncbi:hypothetical protein CP533_5886 [Ophiocordyceps camponoti-saundersi (nom. inval.)]|nr:hypothetical protein CP533_5886 [Ophiocordyceps camponoti-saundersi (nom. inval.)]
MKVEDASTREEIRVVVSLQVWRRSRPAPLYTHRHLESVYLYGVITAISFLLSSQVKSFFSENELEMRTRKETTHSLPTG